MLYVIVYDVSADRRRLEVSRILEESGGVRVNYSVFELELRSGGLGGLMERIEEAIDPRVDRVRAYRICASCSRRIEWVGRPPEGPGPQVV